MTAKSPYEAALGARFGELHPALRDYFSAIAQSHIGVGEGTFAEFGTPRRWLWPFLTPFDRAGVLVAGHHRSVPFRVVNRTVVASDGGTLAIARRELLLPGGPWAMVDAVALVGERLVDRLGNPRRVVVSFDAHVQGGALELVSHAVGITCGKLRLRIPPLFSPKVTLRERFDDSEGKQHVQLTIDVPLLGRVFAYSGHFEYRIEKEHPDV